MKRAIATALSNLVLPVAMCWAEHRLRGPMLAATHDPDQAQHKLLQEILTQNVMTQFGKAHDFAAITSIEDYRGHVPWQTDETLRPYVDAQAETGLPILTASLPRYYARTSGSTGAPKDIPVTAAENAFHKRAQKLTALTLFRQTSFFRGDVLQIASPSVEGKRSCGASYGSASGHAYASLSKFIRPKFIVPQAVFEIEDYEQKYYVCVLLGLLSRRLTGIATANPSTLLKLRSTLRANSANLIGDLSGHRSDYLRGLKPDLRASIEARIVADDHIASQIDLLGRRADQICLGEVWPHLGAVLTWTGASCGVAVDTIRKDLPMGCKLVEIGYRASEVLGTINIDVDGNKCLPTLMDNVFEFVERSVWEAGTTDFKKLSEVALGEQYYVFITTRSGLYRYEMNDILCVSGWINKTPLFEFVRKGRGATNLTGEKLCEEQVLRAVRIVFGDAPEKAIFVAMLGDEKAARYDLLIECAGQADVAWLGAKAEALEKELHDQNLEYKAKRASNRLSPIRLVPLRHGASEHCKRDAVNRGQRESQYKPVFLSLTCDWKADLSEFLLPVMQP